jgi:hypothetical protein
MNEWVSAIGGILLTGNDLSVERKTYFSVICRSKIRIKQTLDKIQPSSLMGCLQFAVQDKDHLIQHLKTTINLHIKDLFVIVTKGDR